MNYGKAELSAYCARIGLDRTLRADRETLAALVLAHARAIPFENLDPLMGIPAAATQEARFDKLVTRRRGGFCFEQNPLFEGMLRAIGYRVRPLAARVLWNMPPGSITPRSHMMLLVTLAEGPVIVDVGFGGTSLTGVLDLVPDRAQQTPFERFRFLREGENWRQQIEIAGEWRDTCRFDLNHHHALDFDAANWWVSTHPESRFTQGLSCAQVFDDHRVALRDGMFSAYYRDGRIERRAVQGAEDAVRIIEDGFAIMPDDRMALVARLIELGARRAN